MMASQTNRSSSLMGPAVMPSGGSMVRDLYSWKRRLEATVFIFGVGFGFFLSLAVAVTVTVTVAGVGARWWW